MPLEPLHHQEDCLEESRGCAAPSPPPSLDWDSRWVATTQLPGNKWPSWGELASPLALPGFQPQLDPLKPHQPFGGPSPDLLVCQLVTATSFIPGAAAGETVLVKEPPRVSAHTSGCHEVVSLWVVISHICSPTCLMQSMCGGSSFWQLWPSHPPSERQGGTAPGCSLVTSSQRIHLFLSFPRI